MGLTLKSLPLVAFSQYCEPATDSFNLNRWGLPLQVCSRASLKHKPHKRNSHCWKKASVSWVNPHLHSVTVRRKRYIKRSQEETFKRGTICWDTGTVWGDKAGFCFTTISVATKYVNKTVSRNRRDPGPCHLPPLNSFP